MKKTWSPVVVLVVMVVLMGGCSVLDNTPVSDLEKLQGTWVGTEMGREGKATLVVTGSDMHFAGAHPQEWYKGVVSLNEEAAPKEADFAITECPASQYVGKIAECIYTLEGDTLTLGGSEPGTNNRPTGFDASGATRVFTFTKQPTDK